MTHITSEERRKNMSEAIQYVRKKRVTFQSFHFKNSTSLVLSIWVHTQSHGKGWLPVNYPPYQMALTGNHSSLEGVPCILEKRCTWLFVSIFTFSSSQFLKTDVPSKKCHHYFRRIFDCPMYKLQQVIAKVHVIEIAKSALELSYKPVILITWRNVILRK